jgi:hypothetical protein
LHCWRSKLKVVEEGQRIFYDKKAGHRLEVDKASFTMLLRDVDVVVSAMRIEASDIKDLNLLNNIVLIR